jgi:heme-degrading monooxygenase HmoA
MTQIKYQWVCLAATMAVLGGCGDDGGSAASGAGGSGSGDGAGGQAGGNGLDLEAIYGCDETGYQVARPLTGPNFDAEQGGFLVEPTQATYLVHTTQLYVPADKFATFIELFADISAQLEGVEGLVAWSAGYDEACEVNRTLGIWESEEAMYAFVASGAHAVAMSQTTEISRTGKVTHWEATPEELEQLDFDVARAKLETVEPSPLYD